MGKRVLITGIEGFTGSYLEAELHTNGWEVFGTGVHSNDLKLGYRQADLTNYEQVEEVVSEVQPDAVVHLAAIAFVAHGDAEAFYKVNLLGTRNLLRAMDGNEKKPECVLLASSANVYGNTVSGQLSEDTPPNPANDYAVSKLAMEYMARLWAERLPIVIARPFNYTGVGQDPRFLLPKIVSHYRQRAAKIELGNIDVARDFSDVRSVVDAYRRILEVCPAGETINICSGQTYSLEQILQMAASISGHELEVTVNPSFVRANEVKVLSGDPSKLDSLAGERQQIPLEETIRWMLAAE